MKAVFSFQAKTLSIALASALSVVGQSAGAHSESNQQAELSDTMQVYGTTYRNTATKTALEPAETPQGITVIDQEELEMRSVDSVAEALRYASGVTTELRGGAVSRLDLFNIRGFINYQNFYDGSQLLFNDWNLQPQVDAFAVEQIEVFKGPTSVLYGSMPPGGMVNLIAKRPSAESYNRVGVKLGTHNQKEANFESTGALSDNLNYSLVALARDKDGQAETSEEERYMIAPSLDWQVSDKTLVNFNLYYQNDPAMGIFTSLPSQGLFRPNPNGRLARDAFSGDANWNTFEKEQLMLGYKINHQINDQWTFLHNVRFTDADAYQRNTYITALAMDGRTQSRRAYITDEATKGFTIDNQLSGIFNTGDIEHNILVGLDYQHLDSDIVYKDGVAPAIDLFAPDHYLIDPANLALPDYNSDFTLKKKQLGFYLQDQIRFDNLVLIAGGRYDRYEGTEKGVKYGAPTSTKLKQNEFTGRIGALYELDNGFSPYISYAESFEPQTGVDRAGNEFDPSMGQQVEVGVKYQNQSTSLTLSGFNILKDNVPTRDPNGGPYDQIQAGEVRSKGIELEANLQPTDNLTLFFAYTYTDAEVEKDNNGLQGKTPIWIPKHNASLWANYQLNPASELGMGIRYIGKQEIDALNTGKVPSATLVDLSYRYDLGNLSASMQGAELTLAASNLFDERYYSCYDSNNCWFGAERTVTASASFEF